MKVFKRYNTARKAAGDSPILRIGNVKTPLYIPTDDPLLEVSIIAPDGTITGNVTLRHLDRLGNANHATGHPHWSRTPRKVWNTTTEPSA